MTTSRRTVFLRFPLLLALAGALAAAPPAHARVIDGVAAVVNEDVILVSEINDQMRPFIRELRQRYEGDELQQQLQELQEAVIKKAIEDRLVLQVAARVGVTADESQVDERMDAVVKRFGSIKAFEEEMHKRGMTPREFRDQIKDQVIVQETIRQVVGSKITVTENEIEDYYNAHRDNFDLAPARRIRLIFLQYDPDMPLFHRDQVRQRAEQIRLLADEGARMAELAAKFSEGPHGPKGGDVGYVTRGDVLPAIEDAVFSAEVNGPPTIVETDAGVYLFTVTDVRPGRTVPLSEARLQIERRLREDKQAERYEDWIAELKRQSFIDRKL